MDKVTIHRNGQSVDCWGKWEEDSNCQCVFSDERHDGIWADGAENWTEAVEKLTAYAERNNIELIELVAC